MIRFPDLARMSREVLDIDLSRSQVSAMERYASRMLEWNERFNLTAITKPSEIETKHFLDSLSALKVLRDPPGGKVIDVGTGAGFPGIVLRIACSGIGITLAEATEKKAAFCRIIVDELGLSGVTVINQRAESLGHDPQHRAGYRWAVARAVARLDVLVEYLLPLLEIGGIAIAHKGETAIAEAHQAQSAVELLGGKLTQVLPVHLPRVAETRHLVVVEKTAATPDRYPRRPGIPSKRPLAG